MSKMNFPEYQEHIGGLQAAADGQHRFFINIGTVTLSPLHHHDYAELSFFVEGTGTEHINGVTHRVEAGTASFLLPHHMHMLESDSGRTMSKYRCMFDLQLLFGEHEDPEFSRLVYGIGTTSPSFVQFGGAAAERMRQTLEQLHEEYALPDSPGRRHMIRLKLSEAMLLFIRAGGDTGKTSRECGPDETIKLSPLLQYVHLHYSDKLTLEDLAQKFHYSVPHISRSFKEHTGKRFHEYVRQLRMESAITMLLHTNMSVTDIAAAAGFDSFRTFARAFRETNGQTASEFRRTMRKAHST
ncbi:helix-turn-helix transcriptional regulator [Paenibacillus ginsengarvi]|uniref:AraC family transcriptional regulator n=1 Tax=Paenibacillus ginsengarvi TaxID=400777 RepID=A0A3B0CIR6_9BACL|nr:AraC family transcriptional regulator [Paenibacillus ginsengarvi]RKN84197.1 AraC family transcriptional regulator [Paenibacillus ginsengarvi]